MQKETLRTTTRDFTAMSTHDVDVYVHGLCVNSCKPVQTEKLYINIQNKL